MSQSPTYGNNATEMSSLSESAEYREAGVGAGAATVALGILLATAVQSLAHRLGLGSEEFSWAIGGIAGATMVAVLVGAARITGGGLFRMTAGAFLAMLPLLAVWLVPDWSSRFNAIFVPITPIGLVLAEIGWRFLAAPGDGLWFNTGLAWAILWLGAAFTVWRAWLRGGRQPPGRSLILVTWLLLAPLALAQAVRSAPTGDEFYYYLAASSVALDGDADLANNYKASILRRITPYAPAAIDAGMKIHLRQTEEKLISIHPIGFSILLAPGWAMAGRLGGVLTMALVAACIGGLLPVAARRLGFGEDIASLAWGFGMFMSPFYAFSAMAYPEPVAGALALGAFIIFLDKRALTLPKRATADAVAGLALGGMGLLNLKFLVLGASILLVFTVARWASQFRRVVVVSMWAAFAAAVAFAWHFWIYGEFNQYALEGQTEHAWAAFSSNPLKGAIGLFWATGGIFPYSMVLLFAPLGAALLIQSGKRQSAWLALAPFFPFYFFYCPYIAWHGGASGPARMILPVIPWVILAAAVGAAAAWRGRIGRALVLVTVAFGVGLTVFLTADPALWIITTMSSSIKEGALPFYFPFLSVERGFAYLLGDSTGSDLILWVEAGLFTALLAVSWFTAKRLGPGFRFDSPGTGVDIPMRQPAGREKAI